MGFWRKAVARRAQRALDRQLVFQQRKAAKLAGREAETVAQRLAHTLKVREKIERVRPLLDTDKVLEVGSGAHGLIFFFGTKDGIGVDPLADHYRTLFPAWQDRATTIAVGGEQLPFEDGRFDVVLCDNVVDHAEDPRRIVAEMARVLKPGGLLYFTVNVHHPFYRAAAGLHAGWRSIGLPFEITPFADHTVHLTPATARGLFRGLPLRHLTEEDNVAAAKRERGQVRVRHPGERLKRLFYKNALYETIAERR